jgi:hypothetical protein
MKTFPQFLSVYETQIQSPNYLRDIFPRTVSGWHNFSADARRKMEQWERDRLTADGLSENQDGSWTRPNPPRRNLRTEHLPS